MYKFIMICLLLVSIVQSDDSKNNDFDNDLVPNYMDKCPNTPEGVFVTLDGCTKEIYRDVYFDHGTASISDKYYDFILETAELIYELPGYKVYIKGHTDSIASAKINMELSKRRVLAVRKILTDNKVDKNKIKISWYGETMPVSTNITAVGRSENRRVNIILK